MYVHIEWNVHFTDCLTALVCDQTHSLLEAGKLQALQESHVCTYCTSARETSLNFPTLHACDQLHCYMCMYMYAHMYIFMCVHVHVAWFTLCVYEPWCGVRQVAYISC